MEPHFRQATIIGVGLIGGSLAGILKTRNIAASVVGVGRDKENLDTAVRMGLIDCYFHDAKKGVQGSDLVVLCCPVGMFEDVAKEIKPYLDDRAIVTDAGSVKGSLVYRLEEIFYLKARYVPAHPIAGSERSGAAAAGAAGPRRAGARYRRSAVVNRLAARSYSRLFVTCRSRKKTAELLVPTIFTCSRMELACCSSSTCSVTNHCISACVAKSCSFCASA